MPEKTWWDCVKNDMESLGLSQKDTQSRNKWRRRIKGQLVNPGSPGKWPFKRSVCACADSQHSETGLWFVHPVSPKYLTIKTPPFLHFVLRLKNVPIKFVKL